MSASSSVLFEPIQVGAFQCKSRIVYAPLTRSRALDNIPQPAAVTYYGQRAYDGGLMLSEATVVSSAGRGYPNTPGIWSEEQIEAWKPITKAVHDKKGFFLCQIWHCGRASLPDFQPDGGAPVGPSAVAAGQGNQAFSPVQMKMVDYPVPRALEIPEIKEIVQQYADGAKNALAAGFDGVEIHGANGYLPDQFLKQSSNKRTDEYGGSQENRCRFLLEIVEAVVNAVGTGSKVGLRLSPYALKFLDCHEPDVTSTQNLNVYLLQQLKKYDLAYVHIVSARAEGSDDNENPADLAKKKSLEPFRHVYNGKIIAAGGYVQETAEREIKSGVADLVAFGRWYLANPDFPERVKQGAPMNKYNRDTFYAQSQVDGYIDYPFLSDIPEGTKTEEHYSGTTVFVQ